MTVLDTTINYGIPLPGFNKPVWHDDYRAGMIIVDALMKRYIAIQNVVGVWENSTAYTVGQTVVDDVVGTLWTCAIAHTSPSTPTTFSSDRTTNSTRWTLASFSAVFRGTWATSTSYAIGDFVVSSNIYAACIQAHTSGATFAGDSAKWVYLIDASTTVAAAAASATAAAASAVTAATYAGDKVVQLFNGDGATTTFGPLSASITLTKQCTIFIDGVYQQRSTYSIVSTNVVFSSPPPTGTSNVEVVFEASLPIGTPSDGTVTTAKIVDLAVTAAKLATSLALSGKTITGGTFSGITLSGVTSLPDGSAATPSLARASDPTDGFYFGTDFVGIAVDGTLRAKIDDSGNVTFPTTPAFLAYKSARDGAGVTGNGTNATIVFDTEVRDQGTNYNNTTGVFTAPVDGMYHFDVNVSSLGFGAAHRYSLLELVTSNFTARLHGSIYNAGAINNLVGGNQWDVNGSITVWMDAGDTAYAQLNVAGSTQTILVDGAGVPRTYFSGRLVA